MTALYTEKYQTDGDGIDINFYIKNINKKKRTKT